jgi:hypothetical protein
VRRPARERALGTALDGSVLPSTEVHGSSPASACGGRCRQHPLVASPTQPTAEALARLPPFPDPTAMAAAVAESSSSSKGPVVARTCVSFSEVSSPLPARRPWNARPTRAVRRSISPTSPSLVNEHLQIIIGIYSGCVVEFRLGCLLFPTSNSNLIIPRFGRLLVPVPKLAAFCFIL